MNKRLLELIKYKTGGRQNAFAALVGWSPQYLAKLLRGEAFGLQPILTLLEALPEINARWLLLGYGDMLEIGKLFSLQREAFAHVQSLLELEQLVPVMTADELHVFEDAVSKNEMPIFSPSTLVNLKERAAERRERINAKFEAANRKSDELCKQRIASES